jgi:hypothetical protein
LRGPQSSLFPTETAEAAPDHGDADLENQSGLGRGLEPIIPKLSGLEAAPAPPVEGGLASLIPGRGDPNAPGPPVPVDEDEAVAPEAVPSDPAPGAVSQLRDDLVRALLDGLANTMRLDLCGYVHRDGDAAPELFRPAAGSQFRADRRDLSASTEPRC